MSLFDKLKIAAIAAGRMSKRTIKATVNAVQEGLEEEEEEEEEEKEHRDVEEEGKMYLEVKEVHDPADHKSEEQK